MFIIFNLNVLFYTTCKSRTPITFLCRIGVMRNVGFLIFPFLKEGNIYVNELFLGAVSCLQNRSSFANFIDNDLEYTVNNR